MQVPTSGAVISAAVGKEAVQEIWRHCEQRGYYTRLQSPASEILTEKGIEPESLKMFSPAGPNNTSSFSQVSVPTPLSEGILFDVVEVFRGSGNWSETHASHGLSVHDGFDITGSRLRYLDLAEKSVLHELTALALRRVVGEWHMGVPCISFGTLRRPQVRSKRFPAGFDPEDEFTKYHNMLARRCLFCNDHCHPFRSIRECRATGEFSDVPSPLLSHPCATWMCHQPFYVLQLWDSL